METSNVTERKNKRRMRHYTLKRNSERHYASSAPAALNSALRAHRSGLSIRECTEKYKVKRSTLSDKILGKHTKPIGRPAALDETDETILAGIIDKLADWNFPVGSVEIKIMVKDLLDARGEVSPYFNDNKPGDEWVRSFKRRTNCKTTAASNIKPSRAAVTANDVNSFFDHLENAIGDSNIPPSNIFNYDETNFKDEPGKQWVIVRRGRRRTEKVIENSKSQVH